MVIEVRWAGALYKDQIQLDFFNVLLPRVSFGDRPIPQDDRAPLACSQDRFDEYHTLHNFLEDLTDLSNTLARQISQGRPERASLVLPSADQISHIPDLVDFHNFSIADELAGLTEGLQRTRRAAREIERATASGRATIPLLFGASCAVVLFFVISKASRRPR
jgi:hypothetical protein